LKQFDVVVVGAGTAGCLAARATAAAGLRVCLVDAKPREEIGEKICGDALGEHHLRTVGLGLPNHGELEKRIEGVEIHSPDLETVFTVKYEDYVGYMLNRRLFGQWLLGKALDSGATLLDLTRVLQPIIEKGCLSGVRAKSVRTDANVDLRAKIVLDASGFSAIIRKRLPQEMGIERNVANEDVEACYREIRQLRAETQKSDYCKIYLDQRVTPGGYTWIFPKSGAKVNVGLGICMRGKFPKPRTQFNEHILTRPLLEGSLLLNAGSWYDPTRRPLDNLVGNGVAILGDAASLVNPIHGGGIGPSMLSGHLAGRTIVEAFENGDFSRKALWPYNCKYMSAYGAKQAGLDVFRLLLLTSRNEDLNYGMKHQLMTEEDILKAGLGEKFRLNVSESARRVFRGIRRLGFLNKLRTTVSLMKRVRAHYRDFPENPEDFPLWQENTETLFKEARSKLSE